MRQPLTFTNKRFRPYTGHAHDTYGNAPVDHAFEFYVDLDGSVWVAIKDAYKICTGLEPQRNRNSYDQFTFGVISAGNRRKILTHHEGRGRRDRIVINSRGLAEALAVRRMQHRSGLALLRALHEIEDKIVAIGEKEAA